MSTNFEVQVHTYLTWELGAECGLRRERKLSWGEIISKAE